MTTPDRYTVTLAVAATLTNRLPVAAAVVLSVNNVGAPGITTRPRPGEPSCGTTASESNSAKLACTATTVLEVDTGIETRMALGI